MGTLGSPKVKYRLFLIMLPVWGIIFFPSKARGRSPSVLDPLEQVRALVGSGHLPEVDNRLISQFESICSSTTNVPQKLQILNYVAENAAGHNGDSDESRFRLLEYASDKYALLESSNKVSIWATDVLGRFVKSESGDLYKAKALKKLVGLQVLGGDKSAAEGTLEDLKRLTRSSQDPRFAAQRAIILTETMEGFSEEIEDPKEQAPWLEENLQRLLQDTNNSSEDKCAFTMGLGEAYSDEGTEEKVKAAKPLFVQAMQETTNLEQKLECVHMISYCCFQLADYPGAIGGIEDMTQIISSLPTESRATAGQTLGEALWSEEAAFRLTKKWKRLAEIRSMVLDQYGKNLPPGQVFYFSVENGRDAEAAGDAKHAVIWYDRAISMYPKSGWDNDGLVSLKSSGWNDAAIVSLNLEKIDVYDPTNHSERIKMLEAAWAKYGSNNWDTTYHMGARLADEYYAVEDNRGKHFLSDLVDRIDFLQTNAGGAAAQSLDGLEENCLIKLALWYGKDDEQDKMQTTLKKYLVRFPNGNNVPAAKALLADVAGASVSTQSKKSRRGIILGFLSIQAIVVGALVLRKGFFNVQSESHQ